MENKGILKSAKNHLYVYHGDDKYTNLTTGERGILKKEDAQTMLVAPIQLNNMAVKNPSLIDLISQLGLSVEPYTEDEKNIFLENSMKSLENKKI